jgi:hypothetical protein
VEVVAGDFTGAGVGAEGCGGEDVLPAPLAGGIGPFPLEGFLSGVGQHPYVIAYLAQSPKKDDCSRDVAGQNLDNPSFQITTATQTGNHFLYAQGSTRQLIKEN